jgi:hypothetical protein
VAFAQLRGPAYRESRFVAALEQTLGGQQVGLAASVLAVAAGEPLVGGASGMELDLRWEIGLGRFAVAARADGALRTRGAEALAAPRGVGLRLRATGAERLLGEVELEEGTRGRAFGLGFLSRLAGPLEVGAAWSSAEPPIRLVVGVSRGPVAFTAGWAWHSTLPATHLAAVSHRPAPAGGAAAAP